MKETIINTVMRKDASLAARLMTSLENIEDSSMELNRYFRKVLNRSDTETINCRKYLEDNLPDNEWLSQVLTYVVPHLIKYKLPRD